MRFWNAPLALASASILALASSLWETRMVLASVSSSYSSNLTPFYSRYGGSEPGSSGLSLQGYFYNSHCTVTIPHECIFYELVMSNASPGGKELEYGVTAFYGTKVVKSISGMISLTSDKVVRQHLLEVVRWSNPHVQLGCMSSTTALVLQALHLKHWLSCFG